MLKGVNDSMEDAKSLVSLISGIPAKINLIPFNPFPGSNYRRPSQRAIRAFQEILVGSGLPTIVRTTRGDDIDAACGQLVGNVRDQTRQKSGYQEILRG